MTYSGQLSPIYAGADWDWGHQIYDESGVPMAASVLENHTFTVELFCNRDRVFDPASTGGRLSTGDRAELTVTSATDAITILTNGVIKVSLTDAQTAALPRGFYAIRLTAESGALRSYLIVASIQVI